MADEAIERRIQSIGRKLLDLARQEEKVYEKKHAWESALLDWCMANPDLKTRIFRFIDVFPQLHSAHSVLLHLREYFPASADRLPAPLRAGLLLTHPAILTRGMIHRATRLLYSKIARLFIGATREEEARQVVDDLEKQGILCSLDLLGERTLSEEEAESYLRRYRQLIQSVGTRRLGFEKQNVSIKLSALDPLFDSLDPEGSSRRVRKRLRELVRMSLSQEVFVHIDMEEFRDRDLVLKVVRDLTEEEEFKGGIPLGIVLQAYHKDADACLDQILSWSTSLPLPLTIRLVRGAYWDQEIMKAREMSWPIPVFIRKSETDAMFEQLTVRLLDTAPKVRFACATHNIRSIAHAMAVAEAKKINPKDMEFQLLYGMGYPLMHALRRMNHSPRMYTPIGDPIWGMAYLVRRLLENVSTQSFVRRGIHEKADPAVLLRPPRQDSRESTSGEPAEMSQLEKGYHPLPFLPFHEEKVHAAFEKSVDEAASRLGVSLRVVIDGKARDKNERIRTLSPTDGHTPVVNASKADRNDALDAIASSHSKSAMWMQTPVEKRAECLRRAARWMTEHRYELAALEIYEVGKTWRDADADIKEAVDYLYFYADQAEKIGEEQKAECLPDEINVLRPRPRGVAAVIAPWNFPIAILTGMSAAALVTGNTVILKPAEQSLLCGWKVFEAYEAAGIPAGVVNFLPGYGEEIGPLLVRDPRVALIAFTGSKEVGLEIAASAQQESRDRHHLKKLIIEMGGKNAAIVDETADFDAAIPAVLESAFGYAGQKCSALSRLIVVDSIIDSFMSRLTRAAASLAVGNPCDPVTRIGPVIDSAALGRLESAREEAAASGQILFQAKISPHRHGYYVAPAIVADLPLDSRILREELFGPLLAVIRARTLEEAFQEANRTEYALTGGFFSRTPSHIEQAKRTMECGNLYINRSLTGAVVGRHPFGGYRLSGTGTKAGSAGYLREFFIERTISENISRHGFAPLEDSPSSR